MKVKILSMAILACLLVANSAFSADFPIGVFNSQSIAMESEAAKAAQKKLQSEFGNEKTQLEKQAKDLQTKADDLQAKSAAMSNQAREDKQREFLELRRNFEEKSRDFAIRVEQAENTLRQYLAEQIYLAAETIAKKKGLKLVLDSASGSVMYLEKNLDITKEILEAINAAWKKGGSKLPEMANRKK